jgi:hypothetical protein
VYCFAFSSDPPATARGCYVLRVNSLNETLDSDQLSNLRDRLLLSVYVFYLKTLRMSANHFRVSFVDNQTTKTFYIA